MRLCTAPCFLYSDRTEQKLLGQLAQAFIQADCAPTTICGSFISETLHAPVYTCSLRERHEGPHVAMDDKQARVLAIWAR